MTLDAEQEWETWRSWLGAEPTGETITAEIFEMMAFRKVWRGFAAIYSQAPDQARTGLFGWWVRWNYSRSLGSAIRRQVDIGDDVVSLGRLIDRVWRYPTIMSRARYVESEPDASDRAIADREFSQLANTDGPFLNPETPAEDLEVLRERTATVRKWVNTAVAHHDMRRREEPPLSAIHEGVDVCFALYRKYNVLINHADTVNDIFLQPWVQAFRVAWLPDDEAQRALPPDVR